MKNEDGKPLTEGPAAKYLDARRHPFPMNDAARDGDLEAVKALLKANKGSPLWALEVAERAVKQGAPAQKYESVIKVLFEAALEDKDVIASLQKTEAWKLYNKAPSEMMRIAGKASSKAVRPTRPLDLKALQEQHRGRSSASSLRSEKVEIVHQDPGNEPPVVVVDTSDSKQDRDEKSVSTLSTLRRETVEIVHQDLGNEPPVVVVDTSDSKKDRDEKLVSTSSTLRREAVEIVHQSLGNEPPVVVVDLDAPLKKGKVQTVHQLDATDSRRGAKQPVKQQAIKIQAPELKRVKAVQTSQSNPRVGHISPRARDGSSRSEKPGVGHISSESRKFREMVGGRKPKVTKAASKGKLGVGHISLESRQPRSGHEATGGLKRGANLTQLKKWKMQRKASEDSSRTR